jgi:hypothetical protein
MIGADVREQPTRPQGLHDGLEPRRELAHDRRIVHDALLGRWCAGRVSSRLDVVANESSLDLTVEGPEIEREPRA